MPKKILGDIQVKEKPWGREIWFAHTPEYAGKILEITAGHRFSLQYHKKKRETQLIMQGTVKFTIGKKEDACEEVVLGAGDKVDIAPGIIHRAEALEDTVIFEVSTPELDDVVKLHDDYGRSGKGNDEKLDAKLAKKKKSPRKK
ncbi:cupin [Candidatus Peregrinibacteria bacterium CG11_big_fil_rev_8_21_14_0_20_46_8]|nr:MAG: cupin [Candidatus Peregrinibacteria bacterium CG11_big_fil_rev_8_21_14_0_20_46_8]